MIVLLLLAALLCCCPDIEAVEEFRCGSFDIRNQPTFAHQRKDSTAPMNHGERYRNCTVIEGDFSLSMITNANVTEDEFPVFESLVEITGYLLVFQVRGLKSLSKMFPNLRVIGGQSLVMNYALIVYQNVDLKEIGLYKLTTIRNGGVRITENTRLCYSRLIDWTAIITGDVNDVLVTQGKNHDHCVDECSVDEDEKPRCRTKDGQISCWGQNHCQIHCPYSHELRNGSSKGGKTAGPGCDPTGNKCHEQCVGGCSSPDDPSACYACRYVRHQGVCEQKCPTDMFMLLKRRCVTRDECEDLSPMASHLGESGELRYWKAINGICHYECPRGYQLDPNNTRQCVLCKDHCPKKCRGKQVDSVGTAMDFKGCNIIEGALEIEILRGGSDSTAAEKLTEAFGEIEEIRDFLLVRFSLSFVSLHMFKKLKRIRGNSQWRDRYALAVFENENLRQIFDIEKQPLKIDSGIVQFHNNHMLCYHKIKGLLDHLHMRDNVTDIDVSVHSNGDRAICDEINFEVRISSVLSFGFVLEWIAFNTTGMDHRMFLGYQVFYKRVEKPDDKLSIDDDRSACSDSWRMHFESENGQINDSEQGGGERLTRGAVITGDHIQPNAYYAFYVQTKLVPTQTKSNNSDDSGARNAISKIQFVKTHFGAPDPPRVSKAESPRHDQIALEWDEPLKANGDITHYMISWTRIPDDPSTVPGFRHCSDSNMKKQDKMSTVVPSPAPSALLPTSTQTCSAKEGCCDCSKVTGGDNPLAVDPASVSEQSRFENAIQNVIFVQDESNVSHGRRRKRAIDENKSLEEQKAELESMDEAEKAKQAPRVMNSAADTPQTINVTARNFTITNLLHYSEYQIMIYACQNTSAPEHFCSSRFSFDVVRTNPIIDADRIDNTSMKVVNGTDERSRTINWTEPESPNGYVLAYRAKVTNVEKNWTPIEICQSVVEFRENKGMTFSGLTDGVYQLEVKVVSLYGVGPAVIHEALFEVRTPGFFTLPIILGVIFTGLLIMATVALLMYYCFNRYFGKKVREYLGQVISANPEYLSQLDVYKADEWELLRDSIDLSEEIGRGTFGKVFRGHANGVVSQCGVTFGDCAVKTVTETANSAERLHFLIEASVMKQFNTAFIVKLFGVVSDGQPVLVVMELMEKGNLRDYLRSRRPGAEENVDNLQPPCSAELFTWAAQIADGMSYLESLKFCHRDLAARNCMVSADSVVKIGDFGMARDIYYHEYYKPTGKRLMPVRWMAPESLKDGKFTLKSDVWSFGIVLYEMLTLAQQPYAGLANDQVFHYIGVTRKILRRPTDCPDFWYDLMVQCWRYDPRLRPSFTELVQILLPYTNEQFKSMSYQLNQTAESRRGTGQGFRRAAYGASIGNSTVNTSLPDYSAENPEDSDSPLNPLADDDVAALHMGGTDSDGEKGAPVCTFNRRTHPMWPSSTSSRRSSPMPDAESRESRDELASGSEAGDAPV
uniref:receptor protein-tyrosine kinase n=1 Tax=Plectus sambesii TaxID=2011161 RepID=A0A914VMH7_9BILA